MIPLWTSHYSLGKSILTLEKLNSSKETEPDSIIDLCSKNNIKELVLVEENMSSFLEAYTNAADANLKLIFGLKTLCCKDISQKTEESLDTNHKVIVFCKNASGYSRLVKIFSASYKDGFYYKPRIDFNLLKSFWDDKDLLLAIPFYDSFLCKNSLEGKICIPDFSKITPIFFTENNHHVFDFKIKNIVESYCKDKYSIFKAKSIYYNKRKDYLAYLTNRCIKERTTIFKPNIEHCSSSEFCFESYLENKI